MPLPLCFPGTWYTSQLRMGILNAAVHPVSSSLSTTCLGTSLGRGQWLRYLRTAPPRSACVYDRLVEQQWSSQNEGLSRHLLLACAPGGSPPRVAGPPLPGSELPLLKLQKATCVKLQKPYWFSLLCVLSTTKCSITPWALKCLYE